MKRSLLLAGVIALAAFAWVVSGQFEDRERPAQADPSATATPEATRATRVRVRSIAPSMREREIVVNGRTEASRSVRLRAEVAGRIVALGATEGGPIEQGDVIARIATEDRKASLAEAEALLKQRELEFSAAQRLAKKGFRADTKLAESRALLDSAKALVERMRIALSRTVIRAPFAGILGERNVERGAYAKVGDDIALVVDLDPILVVGALTEREVGAVSVGAAGAARLVGGRTVTGRVRYIAAVADPATRTFRVEVEAANPGAAVRDGLSAELRLPLPPVKAHRVSPAVLSLAEDGTVGVKLVDADNRVVFAPVDIIADTAEGVWLGGLPDDATLITVGHEFVKPGDRVEPIVETVGGAS